MLAILPRGKARGVSEPASILVIRYSALGDVVLATSVLEPLRRALPRAPASSGSPTRSTRRCWRGCPSWPAVHRLARGGARLGRWRWRAGCGAGSTLVVDLQNKVRSAVVAARRGAAPHWSSAGAPRVRALLALFGSDPPLVAGPRHPALRRGAARRWA